MWDGETCVYEGPEKLPVATAVTVTFQNDGPVPGDLEIDFLMSGVSLEDNLAAWPDEVTGGEGIPSGSSFVAGVPEFPRSAPPGESATAELILKTPRLHTFICWGGGTSSNTQTVDVATTALAVTEK